MLGVGFEEHTWRKIKLTEVRVSNKTLSCSNSGLLPLIIIEWSMKMLCKETETKQLNHSKGKCAMFLNVVKVKTK